MKTKVTGVTNETSVKRTLSTMQWLREVALRKKDLKEEPQGWSKYTNVIESIPLKQMFAKVRHKLP